MVSAIHFLCSSVLARGLQRQAEMRVGLPCLFALAAFSAFSQPVTWGIKAGLPVTDLLGTTPYPPNSIQNDTSTTNFYIIGPTVELRLPRNLSVEVDALFRHYRYQWYLYLIGDGDHTTATGNAWEFPFLVKYKLPRGFLKPYIDGGVAVDVVQGLSADVTHYTFLSSTTIHTSSPSDLVHRTSAGVVIGGGVDIHARFLHLSPEIRYTRWTSQHFVNYLMNTNQNQVEFLLGITF